MSLEGLTPIELSEFHGMDTSGVAVQKTPFGYSPAIRNMTFDGGRVAKRPGLVASGNVNGVIKSLTEYVTIAGNRRVMLFSDSPSDLWNETGAYGWSIITTSGLVEATAGGTARMSGANLFGRHYMAFANQGTAGIARPRQYDDTNLDPVSQVGPGAAPAAADSASAGTIAAGAHSVRVFFKTRSGYWTALSPSVTWTAAGAKKATISSILIGPANVVGRVIAATAVGGTNYFFIAGSAMEVNDNTTASTDIDFTDAALIAGTPVSSLTDPDEDLLRQIELPQQAWVGSYHNRLAWMGEKNAYVRNGDIGPLNLSFDGGFSSNVPLGWTEKTAGGSKVTTNGAILDAFRITGDGAIQKGCYENTPNVSEYLDAGVAINARVRAKKGGSSHTGTLILYFGLSSDAAGTFPTDRFVLDFSSLSDTEWRVIDSVVVTAGNNKPTSSWRFRISGGDGTVGAVIGSGHTVDIDWIELYVASDPTNPSLVRWSKVEDPEAYDGLTGFMQVSQNDGEKLVSGFTLRDAGGLNARDYFYMVKERSIYATYDSGTSEPNEWPVFQCSSTVGSPSARGVGVGDGWAVIAARSGLYLFNGASVSDRLTRRIQHTWDTINWTYGWMIWVQVDAENRRIVVGVPADGATAINKMFVLEYEGPVPTADDDWNVWFTDLSGIGSAVTAACFSERSDGTRVFLVGGGTSGTNTVHRFDDTIYRDGTATAINAYYQTHYFDLGPVRELFGKIVFNAGGSGTLAVATYLPNEDPSSLFNVTLAGGVNVYDHERRLDRRAERLAFRFTNATDNEWFTLGNLIVWCRPSPWAPIKGVST